METSFPLLCVAASAREAGPQPRAESGAASGRPAFTGPVARPPGLLPAAQPPPCRRRPPPPLLHHTLSGGLSRRPLGPRQLRGAQTPQRTRPRGWRLPLWLGRSPWPLRTGSWSFCSRGGSWGHTEAGRCGAPGATPHLRPRITAPPQTPVGPRSGSGPERGAEPVTQALSPAARVPRGRPLPGALPTSRQWALRGSRVGNLPTSQQDGERWAGCQGRSRREGRCGVGWAPGPSPSSALRVRAAAPRAPVPCRQMSLCPTYNHSRPPPTPSPPPPPLRLLVRQSFLPPLLGRCRPPWPLHA